MPEDQSRVGLVTIDRQTNERTEREEAEVRDGSYLPSEPYTLHPLLEQTDLSMRFHEFPWASMRFYAHAPRRLQKIPIEGLFVSCF